MNRLKFTTIAHSQHLFYSPLSREKAQQFIRLLSLSPHDTVLDVGCGKAEFLIQVCESTQAQGIGVDINAEFIARAESAAKQRLAEKQVIFYQKPVQDCVFEPESFAAAICMGSLHAFGDYRQTIQALMGLVRSGGVILLGEGYWKQEPDADYLEFLGAKVHEHVPHHRNIERAEELGLVPLYSMTSNQDEWDEYEGLYCRGIELYCHENPEDPDSPAMQEWIRKWRRVYYQWGRDTLGFGLYLFLRP